jgi:hypothetical protein
MPEEVPDRSGLQIETARLLMRPLRVQDFDARAVGLIGAIE